MIIRNDFTETAPSRCGPSNHWSRNASGESKFFVVKQAHRTCLQSRSVSQAGQLQEAVRKPSSK